MWNHLSFYEQFRVLMIDSVVTLVLKTEKRNIKEYLKNSLKYSYKKGGSTTYKGASEKD